MVSGAIRVKDCGGPLQRSFHQAEQSLRSLRRCPAHWRVQKQMSAVHNPVRLYPLQQSDDQIPGRRLEMNFRIFFALTLMGALLARTVTAAGITPEGARLARMLDQTHVE